ncbi:MAG TPA: amidase [Steroidobacteraceae bacterium]|nr:amidase [Steroidobacteraceae bacterium]
MTLTRRALLTQALTVSAASAAVRTGATPDPARQSAKSMGNGASTPAAIEADLPAAERLLGLAYTSAQRKQLARGYGAVLKELAGVRGLDLPNDVSPAVRFDPRIPGKTYRMPAPGIRGTAPAAGPFPGSPVEVALAPAWKQAAWLREKKISSVELTRLYLDRIGRLAPQLESFITVTDDLASKQAAAADADLAKGRIRSGLHGVPYGIKDLFDVARVRTTWGAEPYKDRVAAGNAAIVDKLAAAGAVLLGKTSAGALAYGDIWFGGTTRNPWNPEEGSSGSSAGSASATAAGLVGFSIGTETLGSIVSPSNRCGTTGIRPTFGRVSRHGAMALSWSWDKAGPICRSVADCALTLDIINGPDSRDWGSLDAPLGWDWQASARGLRVGYVPEWFQGKGATPVDRHALDALRETGAQLVAVRLPDIKYGLLTPLVFLEAAAAFAELTLTHRDEELKWQADQAWPNTWRRAHLFPAVEMVQIERLRRQAMVALDGFFDGIDALIGPAFGGDSLVATNATGIPCLVMKAGFLDLPTRRIDDKPENAKGPKHRVPHAICLWSALFREDVLITLGRALEAVLGVADENPPLALR